MPSVGPWPANLTGHLWEARGPMDALFRRGWIGDLAVALAVTACTGIGWASWYSRALYQPAAFDAQYNHGVYRYRVLGRELVQALERLVGNPLGEHLAPRVAGSNPGALFTALTLVNVIAMLATCALIHVVLARGSVPEPGRTLLYVSLVAIVGFSGFVVTPYDQVATLLILATLVAAGSRAPFDLAAIPLAALAVATRESAVVAAAALLATSWPALRTGRFDRAGRLALTTTAVVIIGYLTLRLALGVDDGATAWQQVSLRGNLGRPLGWIGLIVGLSLWWWWRAACEAATFGVDPRSGATVRRLWFFALPYVVGAALFGYWFEVRLLVPLLIAELWVRSRAPAARMGP